MKVFKPCLSCNNSFESYASQKKQFCCRSCLYVFNKTEQGSASKASKIAYTKLSRGTGGIQIRQCKHCLNTFQALKSETKSFCSKNCRYQHISDNKDSMLKKQHQTNIAKYGYAFPTKSKDIRESIRITAEQRYGNKHPRFSKQSMEKRIQTCIDKYGKPYAPSFASQSAQEKELVDYVRSLVPNLTIEENNRTLLRGKEVDILIPELKIAIEYNGIYYHSESRIADRKYHLNKTKLAEAAGVQLIQIFSDEWVNKPEIAKAKLSSILAQNRTKVYARRCEVRKVDAKQANQFLEQTHIQGSDKSKHKLGLFHQDQLIALMTFSVGRSSMGTLREEGKWELSRFSSSCQVVGGASKLLKHFIKEHSPKKIISYADRRWSTGNLYQKLGFDFTGFSAPSYWYTKDYRTRLYRYNFRKSVLLQLGADNSKTEWEIMQELGYDRIWDCGSMRFELNLEPN